MFTEVNVAIGAIDDAADDDMLVMTGIRKRYGDTIALDGASLPRRPRVDPRTDRPERRRQVDAAEDPGRRRDAR